MSFYDIEPEILDGMRAFGDTQKLFVGVPKEARFVDPIDCSWYGSAIDQRRGAFAFVKEGAGYEDFVGEFLRLSIEERSIVVYCLGATPQIDTPLAIARRCFAEVANLAEELVPAYTQVLT